ncbi:hypothetical protein IW492_16705 [Enterococcus sp. BWB1-3]|uniref:hypothetical protein n=1 Tax=unclassified Enterococcus TaxID=2608891 RepID=UPI0019241EAA|nr:MULTISPECIES: hypothetical protein [unclassified Enterococcus]MBL1230868.1 hypothetical protein [Enterococcus sp. BWB1-3]MCB5953052.1 hypothetical protein [Enterococcus sp. BWT-B8]MCB5956434.1 hypothetical protein [Enterococcus sp. CWB-B31]
MLIFFVGMSGVFVGAIITIVSIGLRASFEERKEYRRRDLEHFVKEIESLNLLNKKINEILQKRDIYIDKTVHFLSVDDCYISIDDFIYLESFSAQNNFYLPTYLIDVFFQKIIHRKVIITPDEVASIGGNTYKGGRVILENFSEELLSIIEDKKRQMKRLTNQPIYYFSRK